MIELKGAHVSHFPDKTVLPNDLRMFVCLSVYLLAGLFTWQQAGIDHVFKG